MELIRLSVLVLSLHKRDLASEQVLKSPLAFKRSHWRVLENVFFIHLYLFGGGGVVVNIFEKTNIIHHPYECHIDLLFIY